MMVSKFLNVLSHFNQKCLSICLLDTNEPGPSNSRGTQLSEVNENALEPKNAKERKGPKGKTKNVGANVQSSEPEEKPKKKGCKTTRRGRKNSKSATPVSNEVSMSGDGTEGLDENVETISPFEPRKFPLTDSEVEQMAEEMPNGERVETDVDANLQSNNLASTKTPEENETVQINHEEVAENVKESDDKVNNEPQPETSTQKKPRKFTFKLAPQVAASQTPQEPVEEKLPQEPKPEPEPEKPKRNSTRFSFIFKGRLCPTQTSNDSPDKKILSEENRKRKSTQDIEENKSFVKVPRLEFNDGNASQLSQTQMSQEQPSMIDDMDPVIGRAEGSEKIFDSLLPSSLENPSTEMESTEDQQMPEQESETNPTSSEPMTSEFAEGNFVTSTEALVGSSEAVTSTTQTSENVQEEPGSSQDKTLIPESDDDDSEDLFPGTPQSSQNKKQIRCRSFSRLSRISLTKKEGFKEPTTVAVPESEMNSEEAIENSELPENEIDPAYEELRPRARINMTLINSGLQVSHKENFAKFVKKYGIAEAKVMDSSVTHLVVNHDEKMRCDRTMKFFQAMSSRIWIVGIQWIEDSLKEDICLKPDAYEVLDTLGMEIFFNS